MTLPKQDEKPIIDNPSYFLNSSGLPYIKKLDGGKYVGESVLTIIKTIKDQIQTLNTTPDNVYTLRHNIGRNVDLFGRYKFATDTNWSMMQNVTGFDFNDIGVKYQRVLENTIELYMWFGVGIEPLVDIELYFVDFSI